jgi:hypothetical protein
MQMEFLNVWTFFPEIIEPNYDSIEQTKGVSKIFFNVFNDGYFCTRYFRAFFAIEVAHWFYCL